jgi:hypothetical protein
LGADLLVREEVAIGIRPREYFGAGAYYK